METPVGQFPCNFPLTFNGTFSETLPRNGSNGSAASITLFTTARTGFTEASDELHLDQVAFGAPNVYPAFTAPASEYTAYWNVNYTHVFSPTMLNEASWSGTRAWGADPVSHGEIPLINVTGIASYGTGFSDATFIQNNQNWQDVLSINRGSHAFKVGASCSAVAAAPAPARYSTTPIHAWSTASTTFSISSRDDPLSESNIGFDPKTGKQTGPDFQAGVRELWRVLPGRLEGAKEPDGEPGPPLGGVRQSVGKAEPLRQRDIPDGQQLYQRIAGLTPLVKQAARRRALQQFRSPPRTLRGIRREKARRRCARGSASSTIAPAGSSTPMPGHRCR